MSMFPLATVVGTGVGGSFSFLNIPQTYTHLRVHISGRSITGGGNNDLYHYFNNDAAGTSYDFHSQFGNGSTVVYEVGLNQPFMNFRAITSADSLANTNSVVILDVFDYANTTKNKVVRCNSGFDLNGSGRVSVTSGLWRNTAAITSWIFTPGFSAGSRATLYGITAATATGV